MHPGDRLMFGRLARALLVALATEVGGALIQAGRGWVERKLSPPPLDPVTPPPSEPSAEAE